MMSFFLMLGGLINQNLIMIIFMLIVILMYLWFNFICVGEMKEMMEIILMDNLSLVSLILTIWVCLMIFLVKGIWVGGFIKNLMMMIMSSLILCFSMGSIFGFFVFFELVLIPMFLLVVLYGNYSERMESGFYLLFYTMLGSVPLLMVIMTGFKELSWNFVFMIIFKENINMNMIMSLSMMSAFLMKLPMYGVHIWLPKAHVEAPVIGSMILAGIMLKLGGYGILRILFILHLNNYMKSLIMVMGILGGVYCGLICLRQSDLKKLVAYSSVVHSGISLSSSLTYFEEGWSGAIMSMVCHGICSSGLFFFVNVIYERKISRSLMLTKGWGNLVSGSMLWCFLLIIVNMGCPPFLGMLSESLMVMSLVKWNLFFLIILCGVLFVSVGYNIYFYSMINHGEDTHITSLISVQEYLIFYLHFCPTFLLILEMDSFML